MVGIRMEGKSISINRQPARAAVFYVGCTKKMRHFIVGCASLGGSVLKYKTAQVSDTSAQESSSFTVNPLQ